MRVLGVAGTRGKTTWSSRLTRAGKGAVVIGTYVPARARAWPRWRHRRRVGPVVIRSQLRGARTTITRRPRRAGEGYVMARHLWGGARTVRPRRILRDEGSVLTPAPFAPDDTGPGPARAARRSDGYEPAPRPDWPGVHHNPAPVGWRTDGQAAPRAARRGVGPDPAPFAPGRHRSGTGSRGAALGRL